MVKKNFFSQLRVLRTTIWKELLLYKRYPFNILNLLVHSFIWLIEYYTIFLMFSKGGQEIPIAFVNYSGTTNVAGFIVLGTIVMMYFEETMWQMTSAIRWEQRTGTLEVNFLSPSSPLILMLGKALAYDIVSILYTGTILAFYLSFGLAFSGDIFLVTTAFAILILISFGFGLMLSALVLLYKSVDATIGIINQLMRILSGYLYPLAVLPSSVQFIAGFIPLTRAIQAIRGSLILSQEPASLMRDLVWSGIFAIVLPILGYLTFKKLEQKTKKKGGLSLY